MPREAIVDLPCRVKHELAPDDLRSGSRTLVNLLRARERVDAVRARPRQDGIPIDDVPVTLLHLASGGVAEVTKTVGALTAEAVRLEPLAPYCTNCPANALRRPFGCVGGLPYPIPRAVEAYALERAAPPHRLGGALLLQTLAEMQADGSRTRDFRVNAKFEAIPGPTRKLSENAFGKPTLSADELFEPLLVENGTLEPWRSLNVLLWFEAIVLDDQLPATVNDAFALTRLEPGERSQRTKFAIGPAPKDPNAEPFRGFLKLLYVGWCFDQAIRIDC